MWKKRFWRCQWDKIHQNTEVVVHWRDGLAAVQNSSRMFTYRYSVSGDISTTVEHQTSRDQSNWRGQDLMDESLHVTVLGNVFNTGFIGLSDEISWRIKLMTQAGFCRRSWFCMRRVGDLIWQTPSAIHLVLVNLWEDTGTFLVGITARQDKYVPNNCKQKAKSWLHVCPSHQRNKLGVALTVKVAGLRS